MIGRRQLLATGGALGLSAIPRLGRARSPTRVVVVGAGIIGASVAYHLQSYGAAVTILEKSQPASGTSRNSFAWLNAFSKTPQSYYMLNLMGILDWHRLQQEIGPKLEIQWGGGIAWHGSAPGEIQKMRATLARLQEWGYPIGEIGRADLLGLLPGVDPGPFGAAWRSSIDGTFDPVATTHTLVDAATAKGAVLRTGVSVTGFDIQDGRIAGVKTTQGMVAADAVVLAMGNDAPPIAAMAGIKLPLKRSRGVLAHTAPMPQIFSRVVMPPDCDIKQNPDGRIVTGSNFGDSGDLAPSPEVGQRFLDRLHQYFPKMPKPRLDYMTLGYRVLPVDGHPVVGRASAFGNVHVASMHSGMTMAPVIGRLLAIEVLDNVETPFLADYRPGRFA
jgi:glycine/D-amino acid oxidase-like deaminating enzyme